MLLMLKSVKFHDGDAQNSNQIRVPLTSSWKFEPPTALAPETFVPVANLTSTSGSL